MSFENMSAADHLSESWRLLQLAHDKGWSPSTEAEIRLAESHTAAARKRVEGLSL